MRFLTRAILIASCGMLGTARGEWRTTGEGLLPAGTYAGSVTGATTDLTVQWQYSPITGGGMTLQPTVRPTLSPSPVGDLVLDGQGRYSLTGGDQSNASGAYRVEPSRDGLDLALTFESGPFTGYAARFHLSESGAPFITVRCTMPNKDAKPGEPLERANFIDFSGPKVDADVAKRFHDARAAQPARIELMRDPAPAAIAPPDYKQFTGMLLLSGFDTLRVNLATHAINASLPDVVIDTHPSSDGGVLLLTYRRGQDTTLQVVDREGKPLAEPIVAQASDDIVPPDAAAALSPDGKLIAYYVNYSQLVSGTFAMEMISEVRVCGHDGKLIAKFPGMTQPSWTNDGKLLLAGTLALPGGSYLPASKAGLFVVDKLDGKPKEILPGIEPPAKPVVSGDGKRIAFIESGDVWIADLGDVKSRRKAIALQSGEYVRHVSWSPDGKALLMCSDASLQKGRVDIVVIETGERLRVFDANNKVSVAAMRGVWMKP